MRSGLGCCVGAVWLVGLSRHKIGCKSVERFAEAGVRCRVCGERNVGRGEGIDESSHVRLSSRRATRRQRCCVVCLR